MYSISLNPNPRGEGSEWAAFVIIVCISRTARQKNLKEIAWVANCLAYLFILGNFLLINIFMTKFVFIIIYKSELLSA